ncbi:hypothetical protein TNCV_2159911 [Trichonephila clavipes]|nr:hypothetical protein TNCV_2159911 [Trichonephila clavipes]
MANLPSDSPTLMDVAGRPLQSDTNDTGTGIPSPNYHITPREEISPLETKSNRVRSGDHEGHKTGSSGRSMSYPVNLALEHTNTTERTPPSQTSSFEL